ncbi:MAG: hypothetical protein KDC44_00835 [Phaeodactylibacter sp.]|nr:hypothetical protein [Phaeodactylibacter sp.]
MKNGLLSICLIALINNTVQAQYETVGIGDWIAYLPYARGLHVTQSSSTVYYTTDWSILMIDKEEQTVERFSKVDGLSNVGMGVIKFNPFSDILIVVYSNSVIDLVKPDGIYTLFDITNFQGITGDKEVYDIFVENDRYAYLATNYGISKIDLFSNQFPFTTFTGVPINQVAIYDGYLYAAADDGLYRIDVGNAFPEDFTNWERMGLEQGWPDDYSVSDIAVYNDQLYLGMNDSLFTYNGTDRDFLYTDPLFLISFLTAENEHLLAGFRCIDNCQGKVFKYDTENNATPLPSNCIDIPYYAVEDQYGTIYCADDFRNFRILPAGTDDCQRLSLNAPYSHNVDEITTHNDEVWIASGGYASNYTYLNRSDGFFSMIDRQWRVHNQSTDPILTEVFDFVDIKVHPENGKVYAASYYDGLVEYDRTNYTIFNETNSSLTNAIGDTNRTRVSGLAFDQENNLWITNFTAEDGPLSVLTNEGEWRNFRPSCNQDQLLDIAVDFNGYKWIVVGSTGVGLIVFDEGDLNVATDDRCRLITSNNTNLPSNRVNCMAVDLDGDVWVGTEQGTIVFECGSNVFENDCTGSLRIVEQDNFGAYLLETENIRTIAVDGANNKWFGTDNGIFVQSPNGEQQIAFYDVNNSPLFDNIINDIAINANDGEVFIGTNKGLQSIRGKATGAEDFNSSSPNVFPNPVRPEYDGPIAVSGLAQNANVKITDVNGQLVYEAKASGGQIVWDGTDYNGRRASSGVYLVFSTSSNSLNAPNTVVAKILFIN